jgi:2-deoxy-D-gluconate 3-dehydrogenase
VLDDSIAQLFDLSGKTAVVTGGGEGIGKATALRLAGAGADVVVGDNDADSASRIAEEITATGHRALAIEADVSSVADAKKLIAKTVEAFGRLDILVNNAGIYPPSPVLDVTEEMWDKVLDTNLRGLFFYSQAAAHQMIALKRGGKIINIASLEALHPTLALSHYDASKGGVLMTTKALALELAPHGILVNCIAPGIIRTPGLEELLGILIPTGAPFEETAEMFLPRVPIGRVGTPDDVAKVVLFLAGAAADYMTGSLVLVDGGYLVS